MTMELLREKAICDLRDRIEVNTVRLELWESCLNLGTQRLPVAESSTGRSDQPQRVSTVPLTDWC